MLTVQYNSFLSFESFDAFPKTADVSQVATDKFGHRS